MVVESMVKKAGGKFSSHKSRNDIAEIKIGIGDQAPSLLLARPRSYMNESGGPVKALADFFKTPTSQIIVLHDELDIAFGTIRVKVGGGDNGHNGLKSLTQSLGTSEFFRIRLGIGRPLGQQDPADFVLKGFSSVEKKSLDVFIAQGAQAVESLILQGLEDTQQNYNS